MNAENTNIEDLKNVKFFIKKLQLLLNDDNCQLDIQWDRRNQSQTDPNSTKNTLIDLNYGTEDVREELLSLKTSDYLENVKDRNRSNSSQYWIFSKVINGRDIYVKIKISSVNKVHLMSFHYAKFRIQDKPYK